MIDVENLKRKILGYIENNGPSLPVQIAKVIEMDSVFASAILGELTSSHKLKMSNIKVGASHLYLSVGQEQQLERFADEHLKKVDKKAYLLLKENKFLKDQDEEPAVRVALRGLKDFATPFKYKEEIMWRYSFVPKEEIQELVQGKQSQPQAESKESQAEPEPEPQVEEPKEESQSESEPEEAQPESEPEPPKQSSTFIFEKKFKKPEEKSFVSPIETKQASSFTEDVKSFLKRRQITLLEEIEESRNEFIGIVEINSDLGKTKYLLIARNKKVINDQDIIVAYQKSNEQKMPCYLLHKGKLAKKTIETHEQYRNLIKVKKI